MSLSDQRSAQRLINELMEDLSPRSPTASFHSQPSTPPIPASRQHPHHHQNVDRVRRSVVGCGHRRTHSSPNPVPPNIPSQNPDSAIDHITERNRTLSGGVIGSNFNNEGSGGRSERQGFSDTLMANGNLESSRSGRLVQDGISSAPISPALTTTSLPPIQLPFIVARRSNKSPEPQTEKHSSTAPKIPLKSSVSKLFPVVPTVPTIKSTTQKTGSYPDSLSKLPSTTPLQRHTARDTSNLSLLPPPSSPLPGLPIPNSPPRTPSGGSSIRDVSPDDTQRFAHIVAMMENGDSPSKRRSHHSIGDQEVLQTPSKQKDKGKGKAKEDINGQPLSEGRKQTPRRGFIGPGGIIPRIASNSSLARLKISQNSLPNQLNESKPVIVNIPPSPPDEAKQSSNFLKTISPLPPNSTSYLRPAPATPLTPFWSKPRFAVSTPNHNTNHSPSPAPSSITRQGTPTPIYAPRSDADELPPGLGSELVEIPRFKKKELNLGIVRTRGWSQRIAWLSLVFMWLLNSLLSVFFDVNVMYTLVQCTIHPSFNTNSAKSWQFATAAYAVLWAISTLAIWLGWELGYEYWRRWRLPRPAVEPIYLSLPASLHLSIFSFNHFTFLLHIRTSPLNTPYSRDIIPETCHALIQLIPGLLPLLPRAAIAVVVLISFWAREADVQAPYGGAVDETSLRDTNFFKSDSPGELTSYAKGVLATFTAYIAFRLLIVIGSGIGLWMFSGRPLGGLIGHRFSRKKKVTTTPTTPRKPKSSIQHRDPSSTTSPQKSWVDQENEFQWAWRERTRSRIQDAFELCIIRKNENGSSTARLNSFLYQNEIPWGRINDSGRRSNKSQNRLDESDIELNIRELNTGDARYNDPGKMKKSISTGNFINTFVEGKDLPSSITTPEKEHEHVLSKTPEPGRPESTLDPTGTRLHTSPSRANTATSSSATDLFYTPYEGNTPKTDKNQSVASNINNIYKMPSQPQIFPRHPARGIPPPPSSFKPSTSIDEFGMKQVSTRKINETEAPLRKSGDSGDSGHGDNESTGLLTNSTSRSDSVMADSSSPGNSIRNRSRSAANRSSINDGSQSHHSNSQSGSGASSRSSSLNKSQRSRSNTTSILPSKESLRRVRSSSVTFLRDTVTNAANAAMNGSAGQLVRRARSGTILSTDTSKYSKMDANDGENGDEAQYENEKGQDDDFDIIHHGKTPPRSRRGTGLGLGLPFAIEERTIV
ncbi:uncharacterized protein L201_000682 [Kwoniella dendrophila CBS 6074]|uniref:Uncharacterized protein n=1 Tax=Kwoniella dendrophila CBS 6074 TaxID=1295534 RepID=A0AAX4JMR0_9TREE